MSRGRFLRDVWRKSDGDPIKAWAKVSASQTLLDSFNVASIVDNGTGDFTLNWSTPFVNANYVASGIADGGILDFQGTVTAGSMRFRVLDYAGAPTDRPAFVLVTGDT